MSYTLIRALNLLFDIIIIALIVRVISSWLPISKENAFFRIIYQVTEPLLSPIRSLIQKTSFGKNMMVDFSPIIVFLLLRILRSVLTGILG
ncbi:YggT family protein [Herbivorax sp. ANBcel31]|uniref:YggT family protein n=1 Tax=Herbivorax sp. ANBcel31 TaxID=3069754 RepID=UPI0027AF2A2A|nr:YggT family protein [Herbivorax sp. ANBcel31]MDQ2086619.1 YggT family protein [Herbivorax sp. ANBcel31]